MLLRIRAGQASRDSNSQADGRSAYVCPTEPCVAGVGAKDRLMRAFKSKLSPQQIQHAEEVLRCQLR
ncbi:MAG: DUF448 domain-containing protein [Chthonomonas sp.]|nr:DUF448 domain-containing protein [Chthonomonas sp.]